MNCEIQNECVNGGAVVLTHTRTHTYVHAWTLLVHFTHVCVGNQLRYARCNCLVSTQTEVRSAIAVCEEHSAMNEDGACGSGGGPPPRGADEDVGSEALRAADRELEQAIRSIRQQLATDVRVRQQQRECYLRNKHAHVLQNVNDAAQKMAAAPHASPGKRQRYIEKQKEKERIEQRRQRHHDVNYNSSALATDCKFSYGEVCWPGRRDNLEDRCTIAVPVPEPMSHDREPNVWYYFGVFDGHGGTAAADFAAKYLHHDFARSWRHEVAARGYRKGRTPPHENKGDGGARLNMNDDPTDADVTTLECEPGPSEARRVNGAVDTTGGRNDDDNACRGATYAKWIEEDVAEAAIIGRALKRAFEKCDRNFLHTAEKTNSPCGTTALVCLVSHRTGVVVTANAGDCRAILSVDGKASDISWDHKPNVRTERRRIEENGGNVKCLMGTWRVTRGGDLHALAPHNRVWLSVSRGIGDLPLKRPSLLVSSEPDIFVHRPPHYRETHPATASNTGAEDNGGHTLALDAIARSAMTTTPSKALFAQVTDIEAGAGGGDDDAKTNDDQSVDVTKANAAGAGNGKVQYEEADTATPEMPLLIMACDGVYDVLSSQKVVEAALEGLVQGGGSMKEAAACVVRTAYHSGSEDNLSCVVISLSGEKEFRSRHMSGTGSPKTKKCAKMSMIARHQLERIRCRDAQEEESKRRRLLFASRGLSLSLNQELNQARRLLEVANHQHQQQHSNSKDHPNYRLESVGAPHTNGSGSHEDGDARCANGTTTTAAAEPLEEENKLHEDTESLRGHDADDGVDIWDFETENNTEYRRARDDIGEE